VHDLPEWNSFRLLCYLQVMDHHNSYLVVSEFCGPVVIGFDSPVRPNLSSARNSSSTFVIRPRLFQLSFWHIITKTNRRSGITACWRLSKLALVAFKRGHPNTLGRVGRPRCSWITRLTVNLLLLLQLQLLLVKRCSRCTVGLHPSSSQRYVIGRGQLHSATVGRTHYMRVSFIRAPVSLQAITA